MQEMREDFARDRGKWRREKEIDLRKERRRKQKPFHSTSSTLHHSDQKENLRTTFAKTNPRRENVRGRRRDETLKKNPFSVGDEFLPPPLHVRVARQSGGSRVNSVHA